MLISFSSSESFPHKGWCYYELLAHAWYRHSFRTSERKNCAFPAGLWEAHRGAPTRSGHQTTSGALMWPKDAAARKTPTWVWSPDNTWAEVGRNDTSYSLQPKLFRGTMNFCLHKLYFEKRHRGRAWQPAGLSSRLFLLSTGSSCFFVRSGWQDGQEKHWNTHEKPEHLCGTLRILAKWEAGILELVTLLAVLTPAKVHTHIPGDRICLRTLFLSAFGTSQGRSHGPEDMSPSTQGQSLRRELVLEMWDRKKKCFQFLGFCFIVYFCSAGIEPTTLHVLGRPSELHPLCSKFSFRDGNIAQLIESFPNMYEALGWILSTT